MAPLHKSSATLRIMGKDLLPENVTTLLGCEPSLSWSKGQVVKLDNTGREIVRRRGYWGLDATDCDPGSLDAQVAELLGKLTQDLSVWKSLSEQYEVTLFCGLFMQISDEGLSISPETLFALGQRDVELDLCLYAPDKELSDNAPCPCGSGKTYGACCNSWRKEVNNAVT